ncbi:type ISP restriction/modification enzyme [Microbacterium sp. NPDC057407]|uniref:type ISP restriction/modification enzyme n=1 Tax=Microbacterium sp. NPDC057407 TaxID=3346120 RepID=UPI00366B6F71
MSDFDRRVRPDFGVSIDGVVMGYVEVKAPGVGIDPIKMTGHDLKQWERQRDLPNLIYTNGTEWRHYLDGELVAEATLTDQPLQEVGGALTSTPAFETLLGAFLGWKVADITSITALVSAIAPRTRLLRGEVLDQLEGERRKVRQGEPEGEQPFIGLSKDWRRLLFPLATDETFADGYAQSVTFALLLARTSGIDLVHRSLHEVGAELGVEHSLMGRALQLLTNDVASDFRVSLDLLVTSISAVRWDRIRRTSRDVYLYLYEEFLARYDDQLRQDSGTYYTPVALVEEMVRFTDDVLRESLGIPEGFASPDVFTVDPAMGTGTFLQSVIERVRNRVTETAGAGAASGALTELATRFAGFELQMGPFAVAEMRVTELLAEGGASIPKGGLQLYVTDTLDDPYADLTHIASGLQTIAKSREKANELKRSRKVNVVIGNPPYRELAAGAGAWVETGHADGNGAPPIFARFLDGVPGKLAAKLKNLYVFFWRWATWKVWESTPANDTGVVCFITTSGYLRGSAFTAMRRYLRETASDGWIIDLTPEGQTPDVPTRVFPGVRQTLAIGIFVRRPDTSTDTPANIRYTAVRGTRAEKFAALAELGADSARWEAARVGWTDPLTAAAASDWDEWPSLAHLFPWYSPGVFPTRAWVYDPSPEVLQQRWARLLAEQNSEKRAALMKDNIGAAATQFKDLPGYEHAARLPSISSLLPGTAMEPAVRVGFRTLDRQWLIADPRLIHRAREGLWAAASVPGQVYVVEQHSETLRQGSALVFSALMPDFHHFNNRGGRTLPFMHPDGTANLAFGLTGALSQILGLEVSAQDVLAYVAGISSHPSFRDTFEDELDTPGVRIPITSDPMLWARAVELGRQVIWVQTYGEHSAPGISGSDISYAIGDPRRVLNHIAIAEMPDGVTFDATEQHIQLGGGRFGPVTQKMFDYEVGGRNVLKSWVGYRSKEAAGKRTSPLDDIQSTKWEHAWTVELIELLTALRRLTEVEDAQSVLLAEVMAASAPLSMSQLTAAGASFPVADADRRPRYPAADGVLDGIL